MNPNMGATRSFTVSQSSPFTVNKYTYRTRVHIFIMIKKNKNKLEKAQRYSQDNHSKKLASESAELIDSRLREKCARRLRWRHHVINTGSKMIWISRK